MQIRTIDAQPEPRRHNIGRTFSITQDSLLEYALSLDTDLWKIEMFDNGTKLEIAYKSDPRTRYTYEVVKEEEDSE
jgi:hypothetical protein